MQDIYIGDEGKGFPLVLVHGFLGSSTMWKPQIDFFKDHFRVLFPPVANPVQSSLFMKIFGPPKYLDIFLRCSIGVGKCPNLILSNFSNIPIYLCY